MNVCLGVEYAGDPFDGWQQQKNTDNTIEQHLKNALQFVAGGESIKPQCSGRTDKGVHAVQQIVSFKTPVERPIDAWRLGGNDNLPPHIRILWSRKVDDDFNARFTARARRYRYVIYQAPVHSALLYQKVTWYSRSLDVSPMQEASKLLLGEHDFTSFRASRCQAKSPIKTLEQLDIQQNGAFINFDFKANSFLYHMVRNLVGSLLLVGAKKHPPEWIAEVLAAKDRSQAGRMAEAHGLYFLGAEYPEQYNFPEPEGVFVGCTARTLR